jgi:hypothetical protein
MDRFVNCSSLTINRGNVHSLLVVSLTLAIKFHEQVYESNEYYAIVGGVDTDIFNDLEMTILETIEFNLKISDAEFDEYKQLLAENCIVDGSTGRIIDSNSSVKL